MRYLLPIVILFTVAASCKKKETNHPSTSVSKGDFLILVVSDSVECAMEYRKPFPESSLKESPVQITSEFINGNYRFIIYMLGTGAYGYYEENVPSFKAWDFPVFYESYQNTFVDSIPGDKLEKHEVYNMELDTSRVHVVGHPYNKEEIFSEWDKVKNLRILYEYRMKYPASKIAFLRVEKENGEAKSYFFINKYKP